MLHIKSIFRAGPPKPTSEQDESDEKGTLTQSPRTSIFTSSLLITILRTTQFNLALVELCLASYVVSVFKTDYFSTLKLSILTFVWTVINLIYIWPIQKHLPRFYHLKAHLASESLTVILNILTFSFLIWECQIWDETEAVFKAELDAETVASIYSLPSMVPAIGSLKAAVALAGLNCIVCLASLAITARKNTHPQPRPDCEAQRDSVTASE